MARLIRTALGVLPIFSSSASKSIFKGVQRHPNLPPRKAISALLLHSRLYASEALTQSPMEANILRILRNEVEYQSEYALPQQPAMKFESFTVQDRPGEQWITMRRKLGETEDIKIEVTMFDGYETVRKTGDDSSGEDVRLHLSMLVDIIKGGGGSKDLEFLCSAWPDRWRFRKFMSLNGRLQQRLREYLEARGVTDVPHDELSVFLHQYMMNKDRIELIKWLGKVQSFVEK
ncbi:hypothetical protein D8674_032702 [Pyrus ussuriensis x Pyrus communis]|uniref:Mitochondrial glycoprotein n=1 Tax=Pyrus ussuriensis x Pyrus communis TaxID=2448454 RepID=A0A5N5HM64_9ROSA|nr:hypothetical protein D8674_032702 [Pyrus ussuriensis x Pyrus communis]